MWRAQNLVPAFPGTSNGIGLDFRSRLCTVRSRTRVIYMGEEKYVGAAEYAKHKASAPKHAAICRTIAPGYIRRVASAGVMSIMTTVLKI